MIILQTANIVSIFDLPQCNTSGLIPFQFHDHCRVMISSSRYKYQIRKALSALQFPINRIAVLCRIVCQTQHTSQRIFIVVLNHRTVVTVNFLKHFRHLFRILCQRQLQQLVGTMNGIVDRLEFLPLDGIEKFLPHFFVGNLGSFCIEVVSQIAQMYQQSQNIVCSFKSTHIVLKCFRIDGNMFSGNHPNNLIPQAVLIADDVHFQSLIGFCLCPVTVKDAVHHR